MINMKFFRVVLALLGGTHVLFAQPSASPTVKSTGEYSSPLLNGLNIDIEDAKDNEKSLACSKDLARAYTWKGKETARAEYLAIISRSLEFYSETGSNVYHLPDVTLFRETLYKRNNRNQDHQLFNETFIHTRRGNMGQSITKDERERNVSPTFPLEIFSTKIVDYIQRDFPIPFRSR